MTEIGSRLAAERLRARGSETGLIEVLTHSEGGNMSGGSLRSGIMMRQEEPAARLQDPWLLAPSSLTGKADLPPRWVRCHPPP